MTDIPRLTDEEIKKERDVLAEWMVDEAMRQVRDLREENKKLREAVTEAIHTLQKARILGGSEWGYNPLPPVLWPMLAKLEHVLQKEDKGHDK